jgi:hypothetical protein
VKVEYKKGYDITYNAMELAALVALWLPPAVLRLASAELAEVFSRLGHYIFEQLHLDPPQLLPCPLMSVMVDGSRGVCPSVG